LQVHFGGVSYAADDPARGGSMRGDNFGHLAAPALAGENKFVFVPRADSPGNDHFRVDNSSLEECERRCEAQSECNAFTYNQLQSVCLLKYSANRQLTFYAFAVTGVKLFPSVRPTASATESGPSFVILSQADSPGNDY
jgi:hypothetical protein